jgi:hypothetical protein
MALRSRGWSAIPFPAQRRSRELFGKGSGLPRDRSGAAGAGVLSPSRRSGVAGSFSGREAVYRGIGLAQPGLERYPLPGAAA